MAVMVAGCWNCERELRMFVYTYIYTYIYTHTSPLKFISSAVILAMLKILKSPNV